MSIKTYLISVRIYLWVLKNYLFLTFIQLVNKRKVKMHKPLINLRYSLLSAAIALAAAGPAQAYVSPIHTFTKKDVMGGFDGTSWNTTTYKTDLPLSDTIFCGMPKSVDACTDILPIPDKDGTILYPIDSQFGFYVADFLGAQTKEIDGDYAEGFAGNIKRGGVNVGVRISNSSTDSYKVPAGMGSWCSGLGGTKVKCDSERYTVMEHILSCFETIPYFYYDFVLDAQGTRSLPDGRTVSCDNAQLDDVVNIIAGGMDTGIQLIDVDGVEVDGDAADMEANDLTTITDNYASSKDYSITLKDDGKPLYMWGNQVKRPNDVRMYAKIPLPAEWKAEGADYVVQSAKLVVKHVVTNNPNDQIRPEDLENEAAIGRLPSYEIDSSNPEGDVWRSLKDCYEGDGDLVTADEGDPTLIEKGTIFKNTPFAIAAPNLAPGSTTVEPAPPLGFSADLQNAMTNGWYTTVDREPFEWSYRKPGTMTNVFEFVSSPVPNPALGELYSGPRWRLKPNKFGQDLPGLEIPIVECSPPPYQNDNIKYEVGAPVTTVINLLDWNEEENGPSPLATSIGWVDVAANDFVTIAGWTGEAEGVGYPYTTNGLPMTEDFDLAIYVKGDKKPTSVYSAQLFINEEPTAADLEPYIDPDASTGGGHTQ